MTGSLVVVAFGVGYLAGRLRGRMLEQANDRAQFAEGWNAAVVAVSLAVDPPLFGDLYDEPETWGRA